MLFKGTNRITFSLQSLKSIIEEKINGEMSEDRLEVSDVSFEGYGEEITLSVKVTPQGEKNGSAQ